MNIPEYVKLAKKVLNEDAGSEGMMYQVKAKSGLKSVDTGVIKIADVKTEEGVSVGNASFAYPHDYGFALNAIKEALPDIEIIALNLVY